jgi:hypothetical protein
VGLKAAAMRAAEARVAAAAREATATEACLRRPFNHGLVLLVAQPARLSSFQRAQKEGLELPCFLSLVVWQLPSASGAPSHKFSTEKFQIVRKNECWVFSVTRLPSLRLALR